jgi:glyoxylase-like metal-dependent hydrolase (beta-lactamase superfamily II)
MPNRAGNTSIRDTMLMDGEWVSTFRLARYVMSRADLEHWQHDVDDWANPFEVSVQPLLARGLVDAIDPPHQVSASVSLISPPGHTPGHVSVQVESNGSRAVITGDMVHSPV